MTEFQVILNTSSTNRLVVLQGGVIDSIVLAIDNIISKGANACGQKRYLLIAIKCYHANLLSTGK